MKLQKRTWLSVLWLLGISLAVIHGYSEIKEFTKGKAQSTLDLNANLSAFSDISEHKSREVISRIELSSRLLAQHLYDRGLSRRKNLKAPPRSELDS